MDKQHILHRTVVVENFFGSEKHLYEDQLGWTLEDKREAGSLVSKKIFEVEVVEVGLNLAFYYVDGDTFYGIHTERYPIECKILPRNRSEKYIRWQCEADTHSGGVVIASFADEHDIWDNLRIDGKCLEEVLARSYILTLD